MKLKIFFNPFKKARPANLDDLEIKLLDAKMDWHAAQKLCDEITDPRLLDTAILKVVRAERRYMHYLKLIKQTTVKER